MPICREEFSRLISLASSMPEIWPRTFRQITWRMVQIFASIRALGNENYQAGILYR